MQGDLALHSTQNKTMDTNGRMRFNRCILYIFQVSPWDASFWIFADCCCSDHQSILRVYGSQIERKGTLFGKVPFKVCNFFLNVVFSLKLSYGLILFHKFYTFFMHYCMH